MNSDRIGRRGRGKVANVICLKPDDSDVLCSKPRIVQLSLMGMIPALDLIDVLPERRLLHGKDKVAVSLARPANAQSIYGKFHGFAFRHEIRSQRDATWCARVGAFPLHAGDRGAVTDVSADVDHAKVGAGQCDPGRQTQPFPQRKRLNIGNPTDK